MGGPTAGGGGGATEGQTYCLRWNNHKSNMIEILDALIKIETYVDCTIVVDDQVTFKAHRVVLAANSPYFQAILKDAPMDHCSIIFPGVKAFEMRALLEYMYTGEVNVTQSQIPKIMRIAEELEVKGLFDMADLKEKFNKLTEEHVERANANPYASSTAPVPPYSSIATSSTCLSATSSSGAGATVTPPPPPAPTSPTPPNGMSGKDHINDPLHHQHHQHHQHHHHQHHHHQQQQQQQQQQQHNSSSVISTSSNVSPSAAPSSSSSPPYSSYKSAYANLYSKSPGTTVQTSTSSNVGNSAGLQATTTYSQAQTSNAEHPQWPLSPSAAAAMLSSVYESAPDMNPLKRKKLSSLSSMLMNRDTPILRNVLAQANPADSSQPMPLLLTGTGKSSDKTNADNKQVQPGVPTNNHSFNGSDYNNDKKYQEEPHSPYTDRSFDDDSFDVKGNFGGNFGPNANQKPEWKRYKQYTRHDIMSAIQCVRDGMSALQASRKFGVPSRTLYDKVKKLGITTGRPMNRTMKRSPSNVDGASAAFSYHTFGQTEPLLTSMHEAAGRAAADERGSKDHQRAEHHHLAPTIPHPAAALLDHAFLQQALENRGGDIAGREALHAMALAAAAHAAANRISTSPSPNGTAARSPSPNYTAGAALKYGRSTEHEILMEREKERRRMFDNDHDHEPDCKLEIDERDEHSDERDISMDDDDDDDRVEDLSVARKSNDNRRPITPYSPPLSAQQPGENSSSSVIMPTVNTVKQMATNSSVDDDYLSESTATTATTETVKRELISDDGRRAD